MLQRVLFFGGGVLVLGKVALGLGHPEVARLMQPADSLPETSGVQHFWGHGNEQSQGGGQKSTVIFPLRCESVGSPSCTREQLTSSAAH